MEGALGLGTPASHRVAKTQKIGSFARKPSIILSSLWLFFLPLSLPFLIRVLGF